MTTETVLITGASAGIGWELAKRFAADKSDLVLVARRQERLDQLAAELRERHGVAVRTLAADLARPSAPQELFDRLAGDGVTVDVVVNNAGFGQVGPVAEIPLERQLDEVRVNVLALLCLTRLFLPGMLQRGRGGVLNVASTAAFQPGPFLAVYYATKAFVLSFTEALADEVAGRGLHVTCLCPGPTATEFAQVADMQQAPMFKLAAMSAEAVAVAGYRAFRRGKLLVVPGALNWLGTFGNRFVPRAVGRQIARRLNK